MKQRSLGVNTALNGIKTLLTILFPVMTFWRVCRIFSVDTVGSYTFANAAAGYFLMFSALGIATYAVREGVAFREDPERMSAFASEVFTLNLISAAVVYLILGVFVTVWPRFAACRELLLILSVNMALTALGCDWLHTVYEDFLYVTLRTIGVYALALILFFLLVRTPDDLYTYAWITVLASAGAQLLNIPARRKYGVSVRPVRPETARRHLKPVLTLFANTVTTSIYVNSDTLILGFLRSDYEVGLYSVAVKIYTLFKTLLSAVITAVTPRLSALWAAGDPEAFEKNASRIFQALLTLLAPVAVGLFFLGKQLILIIADAPYLSGLAAVRWLCAALVLSLVGWFVTACVLIPAKKDKEVLRITVIAAAENILLNLLLIPFFGFTAAAVTTVLAEGTACVLGLREAGKLIRIRSLVSGRTVLSILAGSAVIAAVCLWAHTWAAGPVAQTLGAFAISVPLYGAAVLLLKNPAAEDLLERLKNLGITKSK
ncbi:MAG: flippase [Clostridia bacterium]|nr:flippase [Clostridia bacterium]MBQ9401445.1 flippase [Clostridia bacterium]